MIEKVVMHKGSYHDSAFLMRIARELKQFSGVDEAVVLMGTDMNRDLLEGAGFADPVLAKASPMDLLVAIRAEDEAVLQAAQDELTRLMDASSSGASQRSGKSARATLAQAVAEQAGSNLVTVAVPGQYAAHVAGQALEAGKHVFLFSNNVSLEDELALKSRAKELGLLLMGPDCGTAILAGVGLGFANRVRSGKIGLVGASGTGIQEITSLVHNWGSGVSQAIGTGSRDLKAEVDALMSEFGMRVLAEDPDTTVIVLVAKPPAQVVMDRLHGVMAKLGKPVVVRYLGQESGEERDGVRYTSSLDEAAAAAVELAGGSMPPELDPSQPPRTEIEACREEYPELRGRLVGLFGGGSLTTEAALVLRRSGLEVQVPKEPLTFRNGVDGQGHLVIDTGEDFYTQGKPHPMIDQTVRCEMIERAGQDAGVDVLLLDLVLGDGAHLNPAPELVAAVAAAREGRAGKPLAVIASVTGTDLDPQQSARQARLLERGGVEVFSSAARAAQVAAGLLVQTGEGSAS